jgi:hypothetical protein
LVGGLCERDKEVEMVINAQTKRPNSSNFVIIVMRGISKGTNVNNKNYFKWMYPPRHHSKDIPLKTLQTRI